MTTKQQQETKRYFSDKAEEWHVSAQSQSAKNLNTLQQRYRCALSVADDIGPVKRFLDLGCGSGDMAVMMAERGAECVGVDFAPEMIETAREHAKKKGVLDRCSFSLDSALEFEPEGGAFDLVTTIGVIEYFSFEQMRHLFSRVHGFLRGEGAFVVESRNRLFNLVSFNDYTRREVDTGNLEALMDEALAFGTAETMDDCLKAIAELKNEPTLLDSYPLTGVPVTVRHQYTPGQLCRLLTECGFAPVSVLPYHYHVAPPSFVTNHPALHAEIATRMQEYVTNSPALVLQASAYLIHARKK